MEDGQPSGSGLSVHSATSQATSPSFSGVSVKTKGSLNALKHNLRGSSTGLIPANPSGIAHSPRQPQVPTLEQNIAYELRVRNDAHFEMA